MLLGIGVLVAPSFSRAADDESPLEKIMEKVNKHNSVIQKGVRNKVAFAKAQKDVETAPKNSSSSPRKPRTSKTPPRRPRKSPTPKRSGTNTSTSSSRPREELGKVAGKKDATFQDAKDAFTKVKNVCTDCHKDFRVDEAKVLMAVDSGSSRSRAPILPP